MPYKTDTKLLADQFIDRRVKLLNCQREMVHYWYGEGMSITAIAKLFKVNKRLIQFELFPERKKKNLKDREERGGTMQYYDKDKHRETIKEHRKYKYKTLKDL